MATCRLSAFPLIISFIILSFPGLFGQSKNTYWQQAIDYKMEVKMDVTTNRYTGIQKIKYKNNSPDILNKVFFHLYFNTFQPGSVMDIHSRISPDPDPRIADRISKLTPDEIGYQHIVSLTQNGKDLTYNVEGTILEVTLAKPIKPGQSSTFELKFEAQVPFMIRRSGRDNKEGVRYSMGQWYPKMCEYDKNGWNANPYIAREFYGVWGNFDVKLTIDANYVVAASGVLQNAKDVGHGYAPEPTQKNEMRTWHFKANNVHDFMWAADPEYIHNIHVCKDGLAIHTFHKPLPDHEASWNALPGIMEEAFKYINANFGQYPYPVYSFIQGGDGGMEYPMGTLFTGRRPLESLVGVCVHELLHSWYQNVLGFNESLYSWMDEGFTSYATTRVMNHLKATKVIPGEPQEVPYEQANNAYKALAKQGWEEPLSTHADHFEFNTTYNQSAYTKGSVFLNQLEYVVGKQVFDQGLLNFFNAWKFKHPDVHDFIRIMEKSSGLELDWYKEYMVYTTKTIDYSIDTVYAYVSNTNIIVNRIGFMPMPVDITLTLQGGEVIYYTIPLDIMRGAKNEKLNATVPFQILPDWDWVNPYYLIEVPFPLEKIESITIDSSKRMADMDRENNQWPITKS